MQAETFKLEYVRCGKARCHCMRGSIGHGPYWYAYRHDKKGMHKRYVGKLEQGQYEQQEHPNRPEPTEERFAYDGKHMNLQRALRILGYSGKDDPMIPPYKDLVKRYRSLMWEHHPDRRGNHDVCVAINAAYEFIQRY